jgi:diphthamide biosynthesis methyltransferase
MLLKEYNNRTKIEKKIYKDLKMIYDRDRILSKREMIELKDNKRLLKLLQKILKIVLLKSGENCF